MALFAGDIKLAEPLKDPLSKVNQTAQGGLESALGRIRARSKASGAVGGRPMGEYGEQELGRAGARASSGIEDQLLEVLGQGSYGDHKNQQEFERNKSLAEEIGKLMSPSVASQILGGLSHGTSAGAKAYGLYEALGNQGGGGRGAQPPSLSLYDPYGSDRMSYYYPRGGARPTRADYGYDSGENYG